MKKRKIMVFICSLAVILSSNHFAIAEANRYSQSLQKLPLNIQKLAFNNNVEKTENLYNLTINNGDGTKTTQVFAEAIKFKNINGHIQYIDTSFVRNDLNSKINSNYEYKNGANAFNIWYSINIKNGVNINNDYTITIKDMMESLNLVKPASVYKGEQEKLIYKDIWEKGIDLEYINTYSGYKENIVLKSNTGKNTFSFIWKSESHKPILTDGNTVINIVDKNNINKIDYIFNPIYVYDSYKPTDTSIENLDKYKHFNENNYYEVNQIDDETYVITIVVDKGFLTDPRTVYPVVIDPTVVATISESNIEDSFVMENNPNANYGNYDYLRFGYNNGKIFSYVRFKDLGLPSGVNIINATLKLTFRSGQTTGTDGKCLLVVDNQWSEDSITWNNQPFGDWGYISSHNNFQYYEFPITEFVKGLYNGTYDNYGVDVTYNNETYNDYNSVVSSEGDAARAPRLTITYSDSTIPVTSIAIFPSSATLEVGQTSGQYTVQFNPSNATDKTLTWSSSNTNIATVSSDGRVTARSLGQAIITATSVNGKKSNSYVTIKEKVYSNLIEEKCTFMANFVEGTVIPIIYNVTFNCFVSIDHFEGATNRRISEVTAFAKLDKKNLNPALPMPELTISPNNTTINNTIIQTHFDNNVIVGDWVWDNQVAQPNLNILRTGTFSSMAICWQDGCIFPYREIRNTFTF